MPEIDVFAPIPGPAAQLARSKPITAFASDEVLTGQGGGDVLLGRGGQDSVAGGAGSDLLTGGNDGDTLRGQVGQDVLNGGRGDDLIFGGFGHDLLISLQPFVDPGNDTMVGGAGIDVANLAMSRDLWFSAAFQDELAAWSSFRRDAGAQDSFHFETLGLTLRGIETLRFFMEGRILNAYDERVFLTSDRLALRTDQGAVSGNVLANDHVADLVAGLTLLGQARYGSLVMDQTGAVTYQLDPANAAVAALMAGQSLTDRVAYQVVDANGDLATAWLTITITGRTMPQATLGFTLLGADAGDLTGTAVSSAGDVNGDGIDDLLIGAPHGDPHGATSVGAIYVVYGKASGEAFDQIIDLGALDGTNGFVIAGVDANDGTGYSVSGLGDVNGDGIDDFLIGASEHHDEDTSVKGMAYVVFGTRAGFAPVFDLSSLNGSNGFVIDGQRAADEFGYKVASAGDVNGDGMNDILIGAFGFDESQTVQNKGAAYVIFGTATPIGPSFDLWGLDGSNGFILTGIDGGDSTGHALATAGDLNGDGIDDLLIGAYGANQGRASDAGEVYVVFGQVTSVTGDYPAIFDLESLNGTNGFKIIGNEAGLSLGRAVASAGDVNGDGVTDMILGAFGYTDNYNIDGTAYVIFGQTDGTYAAVMSVADLDGTNGFAVHAIDAGNMLGRSVFGVGDQNGDGVDDVLIGCMGADTDGVDGAGAAYLIFGRDAATQGAFAADFDLTTLDGTNGYAFIGVDSADLAGYAINQAGDVNGDGVMDMIIGAPNGDQGSEIEVGEAYVVFGGASNLAAMDAADGRVDGQIHLSPLALDHFVF